MCQIFCIYLIFQSLFGSLFARMICANFVFFNLLIFLEVLQSFYLLSLAFLRGQIFAYFNLLIFCGWLFAGANLSTFTFFNLLIFCGWLFAEANLSTFTFFNLLIFCGWLFAGGKFLQGKEKAPSLDLLTLANVENTFLLTPLFSHLRWGRWWWWCWWWWC